jgi:outer membrane receptor protein involved in Fe transport
MAWASLHPAVSHFPITLLIEGNRLAQIPPHTFTAGTRYSNPKLFTLMLEGRFVDEQFENADNHDKFGSFFILNGSLSRQLPFWNGQVFIAAENMLNREYTVDLGGGVRKIGSPLLVHGGLRFKL